MTDAERDHYVRSLRFPKELEKAFQADYYQRNLIPMRFILVIGFVLLLATALQEYVRTGEANFVGNLVGDGLLLLGLALSFHRAFYRYWQLFWVVTALSTPFTLGQSVDNAQPFVRLHPHASVYHLLSLTLVVMLGMSAILRLQFRWSIPYLSLVFAGAFWVGLTHLPLPDAEVTARFSRIALPSLLMLVLAAYGQERLQREAFLAQHLLSLERAKSEAVLQNTLPAAIAERLKEAETIADEHLEATVLFADIADFTPWAAQKSAKEVLYFLNEVFSRFDRLVEEHGLEKIKTVGDCYMAVAGAPEQRADHVAAAAGLALALQSEMEKISQEKALPVCVRIGIHTGPLVAGVIGEKRFLYDVWGDTVNTASRLEAHGVPGTIQVSPEVAEGLRGRFALTRRGEVEIKGKGMMETFFLEGPVADPEPVAGPLLTRTVAK